MVAGVMTFVTYNMIFALRVGFSASVFHLGSTFHSMIRITDREPRVIVINTWVKSESESEMNAFGLRSLWLSATAQKSSVGSRGSLAPQRRPPINGEGNSLSDCLLPVAISRPPRRHRVGLLPDHKSPSSQHRTAEAKGFRLQRTNTRVWGSLLFHLYRWK